MKTKLFKWFAGILIVPVIVIIGVIAFFSTPTGKSVLTHQIEKMISNSAQKVQIGNLTGSIFSKFQVSEISIADQSGTWLEIKDLEVEWKPIYLIFGMEVRLYEIGAKKVVVHRQPTSSQQYSDGGMFVLPVDIFINALSVDEIFLVEKGFGFNAKFLLEGRAVIKPPYYPVVMQVTAKRLDAIRGNLALSSTFNPEQEELALSLDLVEAEGGVIASILKLKEQPALEFSLWGDGTFRDWFGNFKLYANKSMVALGKLETGFENGSIKLNTNIAGNISNISPPQFETLVAGDFELLLNSEIMQGNNIDLTNLRYTSDFFDVSGKATLTTQGTPVNFTANLNLNLPEEQHFAIPTLNSIRLSSADLALDYITTDQDPIWNLNGTVNKFDLYGNLFEMVGINALGSVSSDSDSKQLRFPFDIDLNVKSAKLAYLDLHELIGESGSISATGVANSLDNFSIESGLLTGDIGRFKLFA